MTSSRDDEYESSRDYQTIHERVPKRLSFEENEPRRIRLKTQLEEESPDHLCAFGGFLSAPESTDLTIRLSSEGEVLSEDEIHLSAGWNRIGLGATHPGERELVVDLELDSRLASLQVWGLAADSVVLPAPVREDEPSLSDLKADHLNPETFYMSHEGQIGLEIDHGETASLEIEDASEVLEVKKCAYCQRYLPLESDNLGSLSFHKHNAKLTNHQNECRSCKKWRINDTFNPQRTADQLHESSVITRERRALLREPEILQEIKDRHNGEGLKRIVWKKFDKECFRCGEDLELDEVELDHTRPLAYLWPIDEHATCLCADCNGLKREKFPADFYSEDELEELSDITGLPADQLTTKDVNPDQLERIVNNIEKFATEWTARTFNATARKIQEVRPEVDLFETLEAEAPEVHTDVLEELNRPPSDEDEGQAGINEFVEGS